MRAVRLALRAETIVPAIGMRTMFPPFALPLSMVLPLTCRETRSVGFGCLRPRPDINSRGQTPGTSGIRRMRRHSDAWRERERESVMRAVSHHHLLLCAM